MNIKSTLGGLAGACALTLLNESVKKLDKDAPRMDLLGMNAVARLTKGHNLLAQTASKLFPVALAGDLVSNSLYYSMADSGDKNKTLVRGALLGLDDRIGMAAELLYSNKGVKGFSNINLHYITLPLLAQYKLTDRLSAELGPELGYMFSAESAFGNVANTYTNKFDLAIDGGFRLNSPRLIFGIRYCAGIFSVREPQESAATPGEKIKYQNRVLQISIGYKLKTIE